MSGQARIDSFTALSEFRASLATFASIAATALDEAGTDIQRTLQWLREDRYRHWKSQVQTRTAQYTQAKLALKQREVLDRAIAGTRSACVEERRAVQITERRLRDAENKFRLVRIYGRQIEKESLGVQGGHPRADQRHRGGYPQRVRKPGPHGRLPWSSMWPWRRRRCPWARGKAPKARSHSRAMEAMEIDREQEPNENEAPSAPEEAKP